MLLWLVSSLCGFETYCTPPYRAAYHSWQIPYGGLSGTNVQMGRGNSTRRYVLWSRSYPSPVALAVAVGDINNDGQIEIVYVASTGYDLYVYALNGLTGDTVWGTQIGSSTSALSPPVLADVDGDGNMEIAVGKRDGSLVILNGPDGTIQSTFHIGGDLWVSAGDVDNDGLLEIATTGSYVYVINGEDMSVLWSHGCSSETPPALADVDNDGDMDVVAGCGTSITAYDGASGTLLWSFSSMYDRAHGIAVGDIDGDGRNEVVASNEDWWVYALNGEDGSLLWKSPGGGRVRTYVGLSDIDGDDTVEVVIGNSAVAYPQEVYALNGPDGTVDWVFHDPWNRFQGMGISPTIVDINPHPGYEVVINGDGGSSAGFLLILGSDGTLLWEDSTKMDNHTVADVDGDGCVEIVEVGGYVGIRVIDDSSSTCPLGDEGNLYIKEDRSGWLENNHVVKVYSYDGRLVYTGSVKKIPKLPRGVYIYFQGKNRKVEVVR